VRSMKVCVSACVYVCVCSMKVFELRGGEGGVPSCVHMCVHPCLPSTLHTPSSPKAASAFLAQCLQVKAAAMPKDVLV